MPAPKERTTLEVQSERAVLAAVRLPDSVYDKADPRLKAMWTHLERIVGSGGIGGVGTRGPGEQQLEIDRRLVQARRNDLERELRVVQERKRREVQKRKLENFTVGIVGYTNA